jgi:glycosyltransferase involved in cell wall biosynthesis
MPVESTLTLSMVIPAYNEEEVIGDILSRTLATCSALSAEMAEFGGFEVIVVNDGSRDGTADIVAAIPGIRVVNHKQNRGYGAALKTGFAEARGDYVGFLDADGTYPPERIGDLFRVALQSGADMVIGSRMAGESSQMPILRRVGNAAFALLLSWTANTKVSDTASGMRIVKKEAHGLELTPALSTVAIHEGLKVLEVPIPYGERAGRSKLSILKDGVRFFSIIVGVAETYNPLKFFGAVGIALLALAFLLGIGPAVYYLQHRAVPFTEIYRLLVIIVLAVTGLNAITFGIAVNRVVGLVRPGPEASHWLSRVIYPRRLRRLGSLGLVLVASAVLLNAQAIYNYLTTFRVGVHWSYVVTGAFLFLTGAHLVMISRLVKIFELLDRYSQVSSGVSRLDRRDGK